MGAQIELIHQLNFRDIMSKHHIHQEDVFFLKFNQAGDTQTVGSPASVPGYSFRQVHDLRKGSVFDALSGEMFTDNNFDVRAESNIAKIDEVRGQVILKRLGQLYPESNKPDFFPKGKKVTRVLDPSIVPHCLNELAIFPVSDYKSLFITQTWNDHGKYDLIVNQNGRFETITVDDRIPVYEKSHEPIWGLGFQNPWELILLKAWAKKLNGYKNIKDAKPFLFLESFSNSNWKYYNISNDGHKFVNFYIHTPRYENGHIVLKTKNSQAVHESGLIPNCAGYELVSVYSEPGEDKNHKRHFFTIRGTGKHKWAGKGSVVDEDLNSRYAKNKHKISLERDFIITQPDFLNLFAAAHITAKRGHNSYNTGFKVIDVDPQESQALYFQFKFTKPEGFFDFSIKQFDDNKVKPSEKSKIEHKKEEGESTATERYLKTKYILAKDNKDTKRDEKRINKDDADYNDVRYETYQIEYLKGYNRGDAHFVSIVHGRYILRVKPEKSGKKSQFAINYCSDDIIEIKELQFSKDERAEYLQDTFISILHKVPHMNIDKSLNSEVIGFGNSFEDIGYGVIGIKSKKVSPRDILLEIDPKAINSSGYLLKSKYKAQKEKFAINLQPGEYAALILKKDPKATTYNWPPNGVALFHNTQPGFKATGSMIVDTQDPRSKSGSKPSASGVK